MAARLRMGEAAQRLGLSPDTVREWVRRGFLKATRTPTGQLLFDDADVESARDGQQSAPSHRPSETPNLRDVPGQPPTWKKLPPWVTKVEVARASLTLEELEAERKERVKARESERQRAIAAEARESQEKAQRQQLNGIKKRVIQTVWIPSQHRSEVIASIERFATAEQLPPWLAEWEQYDLVAAHARTRVQELLTAEERQEAAERAKEEERLSAESRKRTEEIAAAIAPSRSLSKSRPPPNPRSVAEALRQRGITDS